MLAVIASGFEMLGAVLVYVLLALVVDPSGDVELPMLGDLRALFPRVAQERLLLWLVIAMAVFFVVRTAVQVGVTYVQQRVAHNAGARLSIRMVEGYLRWPYSWHLSRPSAELIRNGHQAVDQLISQVFLPVVRVTAEGFLTLGMLFVLLAIAPGATGMAVVVVGAAAALLLFVVQPRLKALGSRAHVASKDAYASLQQSLHGVRDIRILGRERHFSRVYARSRLQLARSHYLRSTLTELPHSIIELALIGFILLFFGLTLMRGTDAQSALSVLGLFAYAGLRLQPSLQRIISGLNNIRFSAAPLADLHADLQAIEGLERSAREPAPLPFDVGIELRGVAFRYATADRDALAGVDLTIRPGEQIGICGATGGGKTTLVDVIAGLLDPDAGQVLVDGRDVHRNSRAWQRNLGVVPQMVFLVDGTLRANIALGVADEDVDEVALDEAIELAQLREFVDSVPDGLETQVGERGVRVSGGQRQRIAIARALYRRPQVLIFDEGTSALDNMTEAALMNAIERLKGSHTIILIAHRLSTVEKCDRIVFMENGRVAGLGTYDDLRRDSRGFRALAGSH
ncbi:ABC transporter ATP-binding protein [Egicoccus halophilus]|uniref:ABC transporter ATP-binding protein n=1 Tax=Egicoccus halophilus TaxID=1670830 RepID=UPI001665F980|nr:ABC transporter ATP-binding protein [Egicoccus halophilus]